MRLTALYGLLIALSLGVAPFPCAAGETWLPGDSYYRFHIVLPESASPVVEAAARLFQEGWLKATDKAIRISQSNEGAYNVWLGQAAVDAELLQQYELSGLGADGYLLRTFTPSRRYSKKGAYKQLLIAGESDTGVRNGVYAFFRDPLNFCWLAPGILSHRQAGSRIETIDTFYQPLFTERYLDLADSEAPGFIEFRQAHALPETVAALPGDTAFSLLPPAQYFGQHPEYYAEANGKRLSWTKPWESRRARFYARQAPVGQLCFGAPRTAEALAEALITLIEAKPGSAPEDLLGRRARAQYRGSEKIWSITPMEGLPRCQCPICRGIEAAEGSAMGPLLLLVNRVAEVIETRFPDKHYRLHTLARGAYRRPPKHLQPRNNVIIEFCDEDADLRYALDDPASPINAQIYHDLQTWAKHAPKLLGWTCPAPLRNPLAPCPNYAVLQNNLRVYTQCGVESILVQAGGREAALFAPCGAYRTFLLARLLWDPDLDYPRLQHEFLLRYYGPARKEVIDCQRLLEDAFLSAYDPQQHNIDNPIWFPKESLSALNALFKEEYPKETAERIKPILLCRAFLNLLHADPKERETHKKTLENLLRELAGERGKAEAQRVLNYLDSLPPSTSP